MEQRTQHKHGVSVCFGGLCMPLFRLTRHVLICHCCLQNCPRREGSQGRKQEIGATEETPEQSGSSFHHHRKPPKSSGHCEAHKRYRVLRNARIPHHHVRQRSAAEPPQTIRTDSYGVRMTGSGSNTKAWLLLVLLLLLVDRCKHFPTSCHLLMSFSA